jgi:hypothetical protein
VTGRISSSEEVPARQSRSPALPERPDPLPDGHAEELVGGALDQPSNLAAHEHQLVDRDAAGVARRSARGAADGAVQHDLVPGDFDAEAVGG